MSEPLLDTLERAQLNQAAPPVHADASRLLTRCHVEHARVVAVHCDPDHDVVLYLDQRQRPRTAWVRRHPDRRIEILTGAGFQATPIGLRPAYSGYLNEHTLRAQPQPQLDPDQMDGA